MAPTLRPPNKDGKRYVVDSDDDEPDSRPALAATTRDGAPSPTPGPRKTPTRSSVKRERSLSATTIPPATTPRLQAPPDSSSTLPTTPTFAPLSSSRAEAMAAKARQEKLLAAAQLQLKLRTVPTSSTSSNETGPSRPPKPSTTVKRLATTNAVASSSRRPSSTQPVASSAVSLEGVYEKRPTLVTDGRCIKVEGSNVARFDVDQTWQAFSQFGTISALMEFVTPKTDNTKLVFVSYLDISSANRAIQKMSVDSFPVGQAGIALWTNLSNGKPRLSVSRVKTQTFDAKVEKWLKGGVITHSMTGAVAVLTAQMQDGVSSEDETSESKAEPAPPPKKLRKKRARVEPSPDFSDSEPAPPPETRSESVRRPVRAKKEDVIEILYSDDAMGMDEDSSSSSAVKVDAPPPPPPPPPAVLQAATFAPVHRPTAPPVVAQPANDSSDSDMDESDDEPRPSLSQLFPDLTLAVDTQMIAVPPKAGVTQQPTPEPENPRTTDSESSSDGESSSSDSEDEGGSDESDGGTDENSDDGGSGSNNSNAGPANVTANITANVPILSRGAQKRAKQAALKAARAPKRKQKLEVRLARLQKRLPFLCPWCSQRFGLWPDLLAHQDATHPRRGGRCFQCPRRLATKFELKKHREHHEIAQNPTRKKMTKRWWCKECGGLFRTHLQKHAQKHQWEKSLKATQDELAKM